MEHIKHSNLYSTNTQSLAYKARNKSQAKSRESIGLDNTTPLVIVSDIKHKRMNKMKIVKTKKLLTYTFLTIIVSVTLGLVFTRAINITIKNQDTMLCNSAKVSGNREYLKKCQCYYNTRDIDCLKDL